MSRLLFAITVMMAEWEAGPCPGRAGGRKVRSVFLLFTCHQELHYEIGINKGM